jgi:hypothetical protein
MVLEVTSFNGTCVQSATNVGIMTQSLYQPLFLCYLRFHKHLLTIKENSCDSLNLY